MSFLSPEVCNQGAELLLQKGGLPSAKRLNGKQSPLKSRPHKLEDPRQVGGILGASDVHLSQGCSSLVDVPCEEPQRGHSAKHYKNVQHYHHHSKQAF